MPRPRVPPTFPSAASHFPHHHPGAPLAKCPKFKWILGPPTAHVLHPPARAQLPPWRTLSPCGCAVWPLWKTRLPPEPPWSPSHRFSKTHCLPAKPVLQPSEEGSQRPGWPVSLGLPGDLPSSMAASALTAVQVLSCWQRVPVELPADGRCLLCLGPSCSSGGHAVMSGLGAPRALATLHLPISHLGTTRPQPPKARGKTTGLSPLPAPGHSSCRYGPGQASPGSHRDPGGWPSASAAGR